MNLNQEKVEVKLKNVEESIEVGVSETISDTDGHNNLFDDDEKPSCRQCFGTSYDDSDLIEPCLCKGTIAKVHRKCLERWLNLSGSTKCELCSFEFKCKQNLRYGLFESIGIWFRRHQNRTVLLHDFSSFFIINITSLPIIRMLFQNIFNIITNERITQNWPLCYLTLLGATLFMWIGIYFMIGFIIVNEQIRPWYQWWKSKKQIQLAVN